ncbi:hypothetical protein GCM10010385_22160 [Streptomyces geysiriensis]|nr:hypothetical protein GCM10010385_22160 [Streptomyces geysiriensis]
MGGHSRVGRAGPPVLRPGRGTEVRAARGRCRGARAAHIGAGYEGAVRGRKPSRMNIGHACVTFR